MQFIGGAWPWPVGALFVLEFRDILHWRGIWTVVGVLALVIFVLRFSLPESPRWLATHGQGQRALDLLQRMGMRTPPIEIAEHGRGERHQERPVRHHLPRVSPAGLSPR